MDQFWMFLGSYWWLVFPLFGVAGAVGRSWERSARRRHTRRLEVLHAKAELRAATAAAKALPVTGAVPTASGPAATGRVATGSQLESLFAAHDAVTARWLDYELDVAKLIAFPAMSDGRQPLTAAFLRAKKVADNLRPASAKAKLTKDQLAEYRSAVTDFEVAFDLAERDARRVRDSTFTDGERKRLDTAKQLLTVAIDQAATPAERQLAYRRVRQELDGLISLSDEALEVLEEKVALELPAAPTRPGTAAPQSVPAPPTPASATPPSATWPVPARGSDTPPGRVTRPKPHP
ncbi:hypothetical protein ACFQRL_14520 [Microbacterium fluvii]|uniref:Secreted protein n=1 Tax=Microbacterium fluvii TaxID=415215 RepID=A0ABW2HKY0_9MICO|nr:hypothetical protein [Microbacterium fluvii]MCU4673806.1 hypothetical protein [Microbacterium fluvii]